VGEVGEVIIITIIITEGGNIPINLGVITTTTTMEGIKIDMITEIILIHTKDREMMGITTIIIQDGLLLHLQEGTEMIIKEIPLLIIIINLINLVIKIVVIKIEEEEEDMKPTIKISLPLHHLLLLLLIFHLLPSTAVFHLHLMLPINTNLNNKITNSRSQIDLGGLRIHPPLNTTTITVEMMILEDDRIINITTITTHIRTIHLLLHHMTDMRVIGEIHQEEEEEITIMIKEDLMIVIREDLIIMIKEEEIHHKIQE